MDGHATKPFSKSIWIVLEQLGVRTNRSQTNRMRIRHHLDDRQVPRGKGRSSRSCHPEYPAIAIHPQRNRATSIRTRNSMEQATNIGWLYGVRRHPLLYKSATKKFKSYAKRWCSVFFSFLPTQKRIWLSIPVLVFSIRCLQGNSGHVGQEKHGTFSSGDNEHLKTSG